MLLVRPPPVIDTFSHPGYRPGDRTSPVTPIRKLTRMPVATLTLLPPPLKWAGGKRWQVPHLRPFWEPHTHRRLVEPFAGGLAVTLGLMPGAALLNDTNEHLVNFYRWLQAGL